MCQILTLKTSNIILSLHMFKFAISLLSLLALAGCQSAKISDSDQPMHKRSGAHSNQTDMHKPAGDHAGHAQHMESAPDQKADTAEMAKGHDRHHKFDNPEQYAKRWNSPKRDEWQKPGEVFDRLEIEPGMTVADLGTGTGYFLPHLSRAVGEEGHVIGLDVSKAMLHYVENSTLKGTAHDNVEIRLVKRDDPMLSKASVDRILTVNTWHHVTDRVEYAKKLLNALTPGGRFAVIDYTMQADMGPPKKIRLNPETVAKELEQAGFKATIVQESLPKQYMVLATKPAD